MSPKAVAAGEDSARADVAAVRQRTFLEVWEDYLYGYDFFVSVELAETLKKHADILKLTHRRFRLELSKTAIATSADHEIVLRVLQEWTGMKSKDWKTFLPAENPNMSTRLVSFVACLRMRYLFRRKNHL